MSVKAKKASARAKTLAWRRSTATVLAALCDEQGVTQQALAERIGWSRDKLAFILSSKGKCEFGEAMMIADALAVPRDVATRRILGWHG